VISSATESRIVAKPSKIGSEPLSMPRNNANKKNGPSPLLAIQHEMTLLKWHINDNHSAPCTNHHVREHYSWKPCRRDHSPTYAVMLNTVAWQAKCTPRTNGSGGRVGVCVCGHHCPKREECDWDGGCMFEEGLHFREREVKIVGTVDADDV
jgi:hypothetical protein